MTSEIFCPRTEGQIFAEEERSDPRVYGRMEDPYDQFLRFGYQNVFIEHQARLVDFPPAVDLRNHLPHPSQLDFTGMSKAGKIILTYLLDNPGLVSAESLIRKGWDYNNFDPDVIRSYLSNLRQEVCNLRRRGDAFKLRLFTTCPRSRGTYVSFMLLPTELIDGLEEGQKIAIPMKVDEEELRQIGRVLGANMCSCFRLEIDPAKDGLHMARRLGPLALLLLWRLLHSPDFLSSDEELTRGITSNGMHALKPPNPRYRLKNTVSQLRAKFDCFGIPGHREGTKLWL